MIRIILAALIITPFMPFNGYAVIWSPFPISVKAAAADKDGRGTDVSNMDKITVSFADKKYANNNPYTIMYFEDDNPLQEFKGVGLPFVFLRNYKGVVAGDHVIRIDVEDGQGTVLATNKTTIHVSHGG